MTKVMVNHIINIQRLKIKKRMCGMNFFRKLEYKYGKYAIHNLMYYIIILYGMGIVINLINPMYYTVFLAMDAGAILHGQIWRLVTFLICPPASGIFFNLIAMYLYYSLGTTLERVWGAFRFNVYFFMGVLGHILAAFVIYFATGVSFPLSTFYLNNSLLFAFTAIFPDMQFYLMGILPIKAKWLGIFIGAGFLYEFLFGPTVTKIEIGMSLLNFVIFFFMTKGNKVNPKEIRRKQVYKANVKQAEIQKIILTHHKCAVCGRTEKDAPELEFRYCSKCEGNLEYCMDHLYTHRHVTKEDLEE